MDLWKAVNLYGILFRIVKCMHIMGSFSLCIYLFYIQYNLVSRQKLKIYVKM